MLEEDKTAGISHGRTKANLEESKVKKHNPKKETIQDAFFFGLCFLLYYLKLSPGVGFWSKENSFCFVFANL